MAMKNKLTILLSSSLIFALLFPCGSSQAEDRSASTNNRQRLNTTDASHAQETPAPGDRGSVSVPTSPGKSDHSESPSAEQPEFNYKKGSGKGPEKWGHLKPEWETCANGKKQSPIDISNDKIRPSHEKLRRKYKPAHSILSSRGHDVMIKWEGYAGGIEINDTKYDLKQCHWHTPSEHSINGTRYDLELHMVHVNDKGDKSVVAILYKFGSPDEFLSKMMHAITTIGSSDEVIGITNPRDIKLGTRKYYRYEGSLTTPPCTEGVIWNVQKKVRTASRSQIFALRGAVAHGFEENARPIQALNDRPIWLYNPADADEHQGSSA